MSDAKLSDIVSRRLVIIECSSTIQEIAETMADKRVSAPVIFRAVGAFYDDFEQVSDDEVVAIMSKDHA